MPKSLITRVMVALLLLGVFVGAGAAQSASQSGCVAGPRPHHNARSVHAQLVSPAELRRNKVWSTRRETTRFGSYVEG